MKHLRIWIVALVVIGIFLSYFIFISHKEERVIKNFLNCWLSDSEENREIYEVLMDHVIHMEDDEKSAKEKNEKSQQAYEDVYGSYMTDTAIEQCMAELYTISYPIYTEDWDSEIADIEVKKDSSYYKFTVKLRFGADGEKEGDITGRIEMKNGKVNVVKVLSIPY